jgi:hypothetical protein
LNASAGVSHQFPDFTRPWTIGRPIAPLPERAAHAEVGVSQRLGRSIRWQASLFSRRESDVLVGPARLFDSVTMVEPFSTASGSSRGLELLLERRATKGLSGWAGYSYGTSRYTDSLRNETFWADFDQRHALNVHAHYAVTDRMSAAATFRAGSNFPLPGYFTARPDVASLFVVGGAARNAVRLPAYSRLDVRAERAFHVAARRVTMFFEVLNVLNHANLVAATGVIRRETGEAVGFTEPLLPRLPSAGLRIEF